jgi:hypothetical protein
MMSVASSSIRTAGRELAEMDMLRWRSWPLRDNIHWSWAVVLACALAGGAVTLVSGNWLLGILAMAALAVAGRQFLLPATYEVYSLGFRRHTLGRTRIVPWHAVRAYRPSATGIILFQRPDPTAVDALRSFFLPYPADEDELLCAVREHLGHAVELP